jgi:hypothetical protein
MAKRNGATKEMRIKKVPVAIHKAILAHQAILNRKSKTKITLDDAAIDLWDKGISSVPSLNQ